MGNLGGGEILVIVLLALIVLGPEKLPDALRKMGRVIGELRQMSNGFQSELRDALGEPMSAVQDTVSSARSMMNPTSFLTGLSASATSTPPAPVSDEDGEDLGEPEEPSEDPAAVAPPEQPASVWLGSTPPGAVMAAGPVPAVPDAAAVDPFGAPVVVTSVAVPVIEDSFGRVAPVVPAADAAANGSDH